MLNGYKKWYEEALMDIVWRRGKEHTPRGVNIWASIYRLILKSQVGEDFGSFKVAHGVPHSSILPQYDTLLHALCGRYY